MRKSNASPTAVTLGETHTLIAKAAGEFRQSLQSRIAHEKAKLLLERGNGTIAHLVRFLKSWKSYTLLGRIKVERGLRKGPRLLAVGLYYALRTTWDFLSVDMGREKE